MTAARVEWVPDRKVWKVWLGAECIGWRSTLLDAEKLGIYESARRESVQDGAA